MSDPAKNKSQQPRSKRFDSSPTTDWVVPVVLGALGIGLIAVFILLGLAILGVL